MAQSQLHQHSNQAWRGPLAPIFYRAQDILARSQPQEINPARELPSGPVNPKLTTDEFRMYSFKIDACPHLHEPHDMNECPYLHPGEKARRRDPRVWSYQALPCPDFRKGTCKRGDSCPYGHGVFECWLHPSKYKTTLCKEGAACTRSVCFFAHSIEQLREPTPPPTLSSSNKTTTTTTAATLQPQQQQHSSLPPILTTRVSTLKALSSCYDLHHPSSPGSILHQQGSTTTRTTTKCTGEGQSFSFSSLSCDTSSNGTSRCASPGATTTTASAAMENLHQASLSLPSSVDSSFASTPLLSEAAVAAGAGFEFCLPASLDTFDDWRFNFNNSNDNNIINDGSEDRSADVAMAAAVALRAQQQQAASAAAAAQAALARIVQTAAAHGMAVQQQYNSTFTATATAAAAAVEKQEQEEQNGEEFALQQLMAGLGL